VLGSVGKGRLESAFENAVKGRLESAFENAVKAIEARANGASAQ
jgi:hypothetical protein